MINCNNKHENKILKSGGIRNDRAGKHTDICTNDNPCEYCKRIDSKASQEANIRKERREVMNELHSISKIASLHNLHLLDSFKRIRSDLKTAEYSMGLLANDPHYRSFIRPKTAQFIEDAQEILKKFEMEFMYKICTR